MAFETDPEPDPDGPMIHVGQDVAGHWLVQEAAGGFEGRFISFAAAMTFARAERHGLPGCRIVVAATPLVPIIPFRALEPWEMALPHAA